jgi:hypothetical protein
MAAPDLPPPLLLGEKINDGTSLYKGKHFVKRHEKHRKCIRARESNNFYNAVSASGKYRGAYQFSPALKNGAAWMMQSELAKWVGAARAKAIGAQLRKAPMNKWHPYWQDRAFWIIWDKGDGRSHWAATVPGTGCF